MTVREMIAALSLQSPDATVVVSLHSQFAEAGYPLGVEGFENGGYISEVFYPRDQVRADAKKYIYIPFRNDESDRS